MSDSCFSMAMVCDYSRASQQITQRFARSTRDVHTARTRPSEIVFNFYTTENDVIHMQYRLNRNKQRGMVSSVARKWSVWCGHCLDIHRSKAAFNILQRKPLKLLTLAHQASLVQVKDKANRILIVFQACIHVAILFAFNSRHAIKLP